MIESGQRELPNNRISYYGKVNTTLNKKKTNTNRDLILPEYRILDSSEPLKKYILGNMEPDTNSSETTCKQKLIILSTTDDTIALIMKKRKEKRIT